MPRLTTSLAVAVVVAVAGCSTIKSWFRRGPAEPQPAAAVAARPADAKAADAKAAAKPADGAAKAAPSGQAAPAKPGAAPAAQPAAAQPQAPARPTFDHSFHLSRGPACLDCHENADKKDKADMPKLEFCMDCHEEIDEKKPKEKTVSAFLDKPGGTPQWSHVTAQAPTIVFSHAKHAAKKVDCKECHVGIEQSKAVTKDLFVTMDACTRCHADKSAPTTCATCHSNAGEPSFRPESHERMWTRMHGQIVRRGAPQSRAEDCRLCHNEASCRACHSIDPPRDHSQSWRAGGGHGLAAAMDRERCEACHRTDTCVACHTTNEPRSHRGAWGAPRDRHCVTCHLPLRANSPDGCGVCHQGTPSHDAAPRPPSWHRPDFQCRLCHERTPHADNGTACVVCHK